MPEIVPVGAKEPRLAIVVVRLIVWHFGQPLSEAMQIALVRRRRIAHRIILRLGD